MREKSEDPGALWEGSPRPWLPAYLPALRYIYEDPSVCFRAGGNGSSVKCSLFQVWGSEFKTQVKGQVWRCVPLVPAPGATAAGEPVGLTSRSS